MKHKNKTALRYVLEALIPYTEANLKLAFKPGAFFNDLECMSEHSTQTLRNQYYSAKRDNYFNVDRETGQVELTQKGIIQLKRYNPQKLGNGARLLLVFDIPELERSKRQQFRTLLRELSFSQIQKSVWESEYDQREYLQAEIERLGLGKNIIIYEALPLYSP